MLSLGAAAASVSSLLCSCSCAASGPGVLSPGGDACDSTSVCGSACAGSARSDPFSATATNFCTVPLPLPAPALVFFFVTPFSPFVFFFFSFGLFCGLPSGKRPLAQHCTLPMSVRAHVAIHSVGGSRFDRSVVRGASASAPTRRMSAAQESLASRRRPPTGIFDKVPNHADRRLRGCRPRRIAPESRTACRPRWRHRASRPPRRKVKAHLLFPLLWWLPARRASLRCDARLLDGSFHNITAPRIGRVQNATSAQLLSITRCLCLATTGTVALMPVHCSHAIRALR